MLAKSLSRALAPQLTSRMISAATTGWQLRWYPPLPPTLTSSSHAPPCFRRRSHVSSPFLARSSERIRSSSGLTSSATSSSVASGPGTSSMRQKKSRPISSSYVSPVLTKAKSRSYLRISWPYPNASTSKFSNLSTYSDSWICSPFSGLRGRANLLLLSF